MQREIDTLIDVLGGRLDEVTDRVVGCFRAEIPAYASLPDSARRSPAAARSR